MWSVQQDEDGETAEAELETSGSDHARTDEPSSLKLKLQRAVKVRVGGVGSGGLLAAANLDWCRACDRLLGTDKYIYIYVYVCVYVYVYVYVYVCVYAYICIYKYTYIA